MQFAHEFGPDLFPVFLEVIHQVETLSHVMGHFPVDLSGQFIPQGFGVSVLSDRPVSRLPDIQLLPGPSLRPQNSLHLAQLPHGYHDLTVGVPHHRAFPRHPSGFLEKSAVVSVDICQAIIVEINRIGTETPCPAEKVRMENLQRKAFPSSCGSSGQNPRVGFADDPELFLDFRNQLFHDGIPVRAAVDGIHRVGIVEVRTGMLERHDKHPGKIGICPDLVDPGFFSRYSIGSTGRKVPLPVKNRIVHIGMGVVSHGKENGGADINGVAPEFRKKLALELDALDPFGVGRNFDGWDHLVHAQPEGVAFGRIHPDILNLAVKVSRGPVELLALPLVHMGPDHVPIGAFESCVDVQQSLDIILAGRDICQALQRVTQDLFVDDNGFPWLEIVDVQAKKRNTVAPRPGLQARFSAVICRNHDENPARDGLPVGR